MILALGPALAGVVVTVDGVGGPVTQSQRLMLQSTLDRVGVFYTSSLGVRLPDPLPMHVVVYLDREAFEGHRSRAGAPGWSEGWFRTTAAGPEAVPWGGDGMRAIFLHEASHHLLAHAGRSPRWLNEGLAQVMETARVSGNALTVTTPPRYGQILAQVGRPTVDAILTNPSTWTDLPADQAGPLYVQGWALTALLLGSAEGQATVRAVLAGDGSPASTRAAIESTYPGGMTALETRYARWRPDASFVLPTPIQAKPAANDALWIRCADGRLVARSVGCR
ncbi:MAG: hypothetical protein KC656_09010 [Myxococcales bacterium]|nr:hypothetical protein [Myxococcales bacterium]